MKFLFVLILSFLCLTQHVSAQQTNDMATFRTWALTPPKGWNSWDCYYSSVNEDIVMQNAQYMHDHLLEYGWEYVVVDIRWYANHPSLGSGNYNQTNPDCVLDEYGRYLPSPTRFPSAIEDGVNHGFKALADKIHALGLKFGIHIMRGLPKYILQNTAAYRLKGAEDVAWSQVYSSTTPACTWLKDNLTIRNNQYGQLYYNSLVELYAEWGVDFIKVDDMARPFYTNEIKMLRKAIDDCGRPMVLSLSPGKTQLTYAEACLENANMWRMMDDLWDNWSSVEAVFAEADDWSKWQRPGNYADCDMLPLGQICMTVADPGYTGKIAGRRTNLTHDEQISMMTLWGICHSPLFFGGELTMNDDFTNSLLTNRDYLEMHATCRESRQIMKSDGKIAWMAIDPTSQDRYLAMFSTDIDRDWIDYSKALYTSPIVRVASTSHKVDVELTLAEGTKELALVVDDGGDNWNYDHGDWIEPTFISKNGYEVPVTGAFVISRYTNSYYNIIRENTNVYGNGRMSVQGTTYTRGFSSDANSMLLVSVPDSIVAFRAMAAADDTGCNQAGATTSIRFLVYDHNPMATVAGDDIDISLNLLGYADDESVQVYDIWQTAEIGVAKGSLSAHLPAHGAKLYRLSAPADASSIRRPDIDEATSESRTSGNGAIYNLQGQRIDGLKKGINISGGTKIIVK